MQKKQLSKQTILFDLQEGKNLLAQLKNNFKSIENNEQILLGERNEKSQRYGNYSLILIVAAFVIATFISIIFLFRILKDFNERSQLQHELERKDKETAERIKVISTIANSISSGNYDIRVDDTKSDALGSV